MCLLFINWVTCQFLLCNKDGKIVTEIIICINKK